MDPDGSHWQILAHGLRNAVDLQYTADLDGGALFATNMGDDHLGDSLPEDTFFELESNARPAPTHTNYGWPTCYFANAKPTFDHTPLPEMPNPGDLQTESERPKDAGAASHSRPPEDANSVYGTQEGMAQQGTMLAAGGGKIIPDPNAKLGTVPEPLTSCNNSPRPTPPSPRTPRRSAWPSSAPTTPHSTTHSSSLCTEPPSPHRHRLPCRRVHTRRPHPAVIHHRLPHHRRGQGRRPRTPLRHSALGPDTFLLTDDYLGLVYYVHPKGK